MVTTEQMSGIYRCPPLRYLQLPDGSVPVYCDRDAYIANYEKISEDHVAHMEETGPNPYAYPVDSTDLKGLPFENWQPHMTYNPLCGVDLTG